MEIFWGDIRGMESCSPRHPGRTAAPGSNWAWSLLEYAVRCVWGCDLPAIETTAGGKPYFPERKDISFSLSHTKGFVLAAVSEHPLGADVEHRREIRPALEKRLLSGTHGDLDVFELWALRESWYKLTGEGDLRDITFLRENNIITGPSSDLFCCVYQDIPECAAAVCSLSEMPSQKLLQVSAKELLAF